MTPTMSAVLGVVGGIAATVPALATAYIKGREALAPLLSRKSLRVVLVAAEDKQVGAIAFANALRSRGYGEVAVTRVPEAAAGAQAVVLWEIGVADVALAQRALRLLQRRPSACSPTMRCRGLPRGPKWLLCNSPVRLRGDLAAIAEGV